MIKWYCALNRTWINFRCSHYGCDLHKNNKEESNVSS